MNLTDIGSLKALLARHGFTFSKTLGQNFIVSPNVCPKMAEMSGIDKECGVIEIGPGVGTLTKELASRARKVVCIELDQRLISILSETLSEFDNVTVINDDALKVDFNKIIADHFPGMKVCVCANLPYYITTPLIMYLLESHFPISSLTLMLQKEAAERISAPLASREVGAVSVAVRYWGEPKTLFQVPRGCFVPSPNVDSSVIKIDILGEPAAKCPRGAFFAVTKAAFSMRRKTLLNCLSAGLAIPKSDAALLLERANVPPSYRAEQLLMSDFDAIGAEYQKYLDKNREKTI
ncbi:MAG: 16S rRNA (adenine(1518)-N(6)/adenine(1519)-N(6))-dimethyltransferase RsmA [Oscillospiraceae bacterium]|nr:16S rRNA (adenine(1518)-N(6)/adenine(1519)-N(6))-dimethyltransferase RsmA [Oscillospiraceae bacterium]